MALNPWALRTSGNEDWKELAIRRVAIAMHEWADASNIPHNRRLHDLSITMLGSGKVGGGIKHRGFAAKFKAAECSVMLRFAVYYLEKVGQNLPMYSHLLGAGTALVEYFNLMEAAPLNLSVNMFQDLVDYMQRHLLQCDRAKIVLTPKHHLWIHLTSRTGRPSVVIILHTHNVNTNCLEALAPPRREWFGPHDPTISIEPAKHVYAKASGLDGD